MTMPSMMNCSHLPDDRCFECEQAMKQIYIVTYDNAQWCGGKLYCLVMARDENEAEIEASEHMEETQQEMYSDEYDEEPLEEGDTSVGSVHAEPLDGSSHQDFANDPSQESYYPKVNF